MFHLFLLTRNTVETSGFIEGFKTFSFSESATLILILFAQFLKVISF